MIPREDGDRRSETFRVGVEQPINCDYPSTVGTYFGVGTDLMNSRLIRQTGPCYKEKGLSDGKPGTTE